MPGRKLRVSEQSPYQYQQSPGYQMPPPAFMAPVAPDGRPLAEPGQRFVARLVDSLLYVLIAFVLAGVIAGSLTALTVALAGDQSDFVPIVGISSIVLVMLGSQYVYEVEVPLRWRGQTPGKRMMKIAMVPLEPNAALTRGPLAIRFGVALGFNVLSNCYVGFVDPLWCLWDKPYRQCLHDKPAKTVVIALPKA